MYHICSWRASPYSPRTLQDLVPGQSGMILSVGNQSGAVKRRLVDMGLTPGTTVKVTKVAPLGDPLEALSPWI